MFYPVAECLSYQREGRTGTEAGLWVKTDRDDNPGEGRLHRVRTGNCYRGILTILSGRLHVLPCCKMSIVPERKENQNIKHESAQSLRQLIAPSLSGVREHSAQASRFNVSWTPGPIGERYARSICMFYPIAKGRSHQRGKGFRTKRKFVA